MADQFLVASQEYLQRRQEIALRLLAECDKQVSTSDVTYENELRDKVLVALGKRQYSEAAALTQTLASLQEQQEHVARRRQQLRVEVDRLCSARATLEQRQELLEQAPLNIEDPYIGGVGAYLSKRHETALRLVAALDAEIAQAKSDDTGVEKLRSKREQLSIESDTLLKALEVHEEREELLTSAEDILGDSSAPDTSAYLRRVLAYLDARSSIILKLVASIDERLKSKSLASTDEAHLRRQRTELVEELDQINEKIAAQKRGEAELKACGLKSEVGDPYHIKVTTYLQNRSDVALQLIAFLDQRMDSLNDQATEERAKLEEQKRQLQQKADETLAQIAEQEQGQAVMDSLGVPEKASRAVRV
jgi:hypothetical protein